jgi:hypothetical protein
MLEWKAWLYGLITTVVNGAASGGLLVLTGLANDPATGLIRWKALGTSCLLLGLLGLFNYLKQNPAPKWDGSDRRTLTVNVQASATGVAPAAGAGGTA